MATTKLPPLTIEDARIIWRNFSGRPTEFNREGDRNFNAVIPADVVETLRADGWNVKTKPPREEGDDPLHTLEVKVSYRQGSRPPRIVLVTSSGRTELDESTVSLIDTAEIKHVDMIVNPYQWDVQGRQGIKAYLKTMYITIVEDELERKYGFPNGDETVADRYRDDSDF